jgi:hypothetical protein
MSIGLENIHTDTHREFKQVNEKESEEERKLMSSHSYTYIDTLKKEIEGLTL